MAHRMRSCRNMWALFLLGVVLCHGDLLVEAFVRKDPRPFVVSRTFRQRTDMNQKHEPSLYSTAAATIPVPASPASTSTMDDKAVTLAEFGKTEAFLRKLGLMTFILSMCITLPLTLLPQRLLRRFGLVDRVQSERMALATGQFCARWLLRIIPFCNVQCIASPLKDNEQPQPSVWVCNHTSMLDVFILLAKDLKLRGKNKRPIKIVYWKQLEDNPVTKLLFRQSGFISVDMAANKAGEANEYDRGTFKKLLKDTKQAFAEGFDIGILPEGQLNPTPEEGLLPVFPGAYTLAKMSRRPIQMMAVSGIHRVWSPKEEIGMNPYGRDVSVRVYPQQGKYFTDGKEFVETFTKVVGHFGKCGRDRGDLKSWLDGSAYAAMVKEEEKRKTLAAASESDSEGSSSSDGD